MRHTNNNGIGVIFDCDGTLLDSMNAWHTLDDRLAARVGVKFTKEDRDFLTAGTIFECSRYMHQKYGIGSCVQDVIDIIHGDMMDFYMHEVTCKPGVMEFVRELHVMGIPMGIASSTPPTLLAAGIESAGLAPYMQAVYSVEDIGSSKREPVVYDTVRECLGTERHLTWGFEDSIYAVNTLSRAGYRTMAIYDSEIAGSPEALRKASDGFIMSFEDINAQQFLDFAGRVAHDRQTEQARPEKSTSC